MASAKGKPGKPMIKTDTPFKNPSIPTLSKEKNEIVVGLLSSLLEPIGRYRAAYTVKSAGKGSKKRKRTSGNAEHQLPIVESEPLKPVILEFLTVGLNSTTRRLEAETAKFRSGGNPGENDGDQETQNNSKHLAAVFLPKPESELVYAHLPMLCYTASAACEAKAPTQLVLLDPAYERRIAAAMALPRAGVIGVLEDAPGAATLLQYVKENVEVVDVPWLGDVSSGKWMGVSIQNQVSGEV